MQTLALAIALLAAAPQTLSQPEGSVPIEIRAKVICEAGKVVGLLLVVPPDTEGTTLTLAFPPNPCGPPPKPVRPST